MKFRCVDQIVSWEAGKSIRGFKAVSFEEYCLRSVFCHPESLPESLLTQSFIELADWLVILSSDFTLAAFPQEIDRIEFLRLLRPGERASLTLECQGALDEELVFSGSAAVGNDLLAHLSLLRVCTLPLNEWRDPQDVRTLFSEIYKPR